MDSPSNQIDLCEWCHETLDPQREREQDDYYLTLYSPKLCKECNDKRANQVTITSLRMVSSGHWITSYSVIPVQKEPTGTINFFRVKDAIGDS